MSPTAARAQKENSRRVHGWARIFVAGLQAVNYQSVQLDFVNENLADAGRLRSVDASRILLRDLKSMQEVLAKLLKNKVCV